jgi:PAS domain S-box-containing protein
MKPVAPTFSTILTKVLRRVLPATLMAQLMLLTSACMVLSILGYGYNTAQRQAESAKQIVSAQIIALAQNLAAVSAHFLLTDEPDRIESLITHTATVTGMYSVMVTDVSGFPITEIVNKNSAWSPRYSVQRVELPPSQSPDSLLQELPFDPVQQDFLSGKSGTLMVWHRISGVQSLGWVRVKYRMDTFDDITREIWHQAYQSIAWAIAATLMLLWLLLRPTTQALTAATRFASQLDQSLDGNLAVSRQTTEIEALGNALNVLSGRLMAQSLDLNNQKFALDQHAIVSITDLQGNIVYANERFCSVSGYSQADLIGQNHRMVKSDEHPPEVFENMWRTITQGKVWRGDIKNRKKDGGFYWVSATIVPLLGVDGLPRQYIGIRTDITHNKLMESSLQVAKHEAEQAALSKGQFLANMSHEIRTPMNAILGMLKLLEATSLDARQLDYASKAEGAAQSLLGLINDILDFSKIDAGKMTLEVHSCQVDKLVRDLTVIASASTASKPVELRFEVDKQVPAALMCDALRLQQVLINLCSNAIKFTAQGTVVVSIGTLASNNLSATLRFSVRDDGIGIAPENQQRIFDSFSQAEASTTRRFGGTGLGLAISRQLVALMGGTLQLKSELGQGSTFWFDLTLPVDRQPVPLKNSGPDHIADICATRPLAGLRLLVVEDNLINQQVAQELLSAQGAEVTLADNGQSGIDAIYHAQSAGTPYDAVLMDLQMPVMDGLAATRLLRQNPALADLPIIAMTANAMTSDRDACLAAGMNDHVGKPFNLAKLVRLLLALTPASRST